MLNAKDLLVENDIKSRPQIFPFHDEQNALAYLGKSRQMCVGLSRWRNQFNPTLVFHLLGRETFGG